jgi:hypothetical protein
MNEKCSLAVTGVWVGKRFLLSYRFFFFLLRFVTSSSAAHILPFLQELHSIENLVTTSTDEISSPVSELDPAAQMVRGKIYAVSGYSMQVLLLYPEDPIEWRLFEYKQGKKHNLYNVEHFMVEKTAFMCQHLIFNLDLSHFSSPRFSAFPLHKTSSWIVLTTREEILCSRKLSFQISLLLQV